eukprot:gene61501-biopygen5758
MTLAWLRLGVPLDVTEWLVGLDQEGVTIVRTPKARLAWKLSNYQGFRAKQDNYSTNMHPMTENQAIRNGVVEAFLAELGTGQGDVSSPLCWNALFDILLVMLEKCDHQPYRCRGRHGHMYKAGETAFADDMESTTATNEGMQEKANVVSAFCLIFGLRISPAKLRRYFQDWSNNVRAAELAPMT